MSYFIFSDFSILFRVFLPKTISVLRIVECSTISMFFFSMTPWTMWDSLKPDWNSTQMVWLKSENFVKCELNWIGGELRQIESKTVSRIKLETTSWIKSYALSRIKSDMVSGIKSKKLGQINLGKNDSNPVKNLGSNWVRTVQLWKLLILMTGIADVDKMGNGVALNSVVFLWRLQQWRRFWDCIRSRRHRRIRRLDMSGRIPSNRALKTGPWGSCFYWRVGEWGCSVHMVL